jgi:hypothetical protein
LKTPELVCGATGYDAKRALQLSENGQTMDVAFRKTDVNYWRVFDFRFLSGRPYTEEELRSDAKVAVVVRSIATRLFGDEEAVGQEIKLGDTAYRICGVIPDVSYATRNTYAQVWVPDTKLYVGDSSVAIPDLSRAFGDVVVYMVAPSIAEVDDVIAEVEEMTKRLNEATAAANTNPDRAQELSFVNGPMPYWKVEMIDTFSPEKYINTREFDWSEILKILIPMLLAMLLVPAVNMAGMVSSMMDKRLSEIGIRKVFGASRGVLMRQILIENLLLTLIGGVVGLALSYLLMYVGSNWVLTLFNQTSSALPTGAVTFYTVDMLFNPFVFVVTLLICFLLNYLSAAVPTYTALRKDIVYSLNKKR